MISGSAENKDVEFMKTYEIENIVMEGSKRLELFFRPLGVAHNYYKNMQIIGKEDHLEAEIYQKWLVEKKIPYIKSVLGDAITEEFRNDAEKRGEYLRKLDEDFETYEFAIIGGLNELEFLQAFGHQISTPAARPAIEVVERWYAQTEPFEEPIL